MSMRNQTEIKNKREIVKKSVINLEGNKNEDFESDSIRKIKSDIERESENQRGGRREVRGK